MRWFAWLMAGAWIAAITAATATAQPDRKDPGGDKAATRPAGHGERGERSAEPRRAGRAARGEGRSRSPSPDGRRDADEPPPGPPDAPEPDFGLPRSDRPAGPMFGPSPERIDRVMEFLDEHYPRLHERLAELRERDPRAFHRQMSRILPRMPDLMNILDRNPQLGKLIIDEHRLEMDIRDAIGDYHRARDDEEKNQIKERIQDLLSRQFDVRQEKLKLMIADMERELERKKQLLAEQAGKKDKAVSRELQRRLEPDM